MHPCALGRFAVCLAPLLLLLGLFPLLQGLGLGYPFPLGVVVLA